MCLKYTRSPWSVLGAGVALLWACVPAIADTGQNDGPALAIELNRLETNGTACRIAFVIHNRLDVAIADLGFELVVFDREKRVQSMLSIAAGGLPKDKTRVKRFDIKGLDCKSVGRVLLNDVTRCDGAGLSAAACMKAVRPTSRADVPFNS